MAGRMWWLMPCLDTMKTRRQCAHCPYQSLSCMINYAKNRQPCRPSSTSVSRLQLRQWGWTRWSSATSSCTRGTSSCQTHRHPGCPSYSNPMTWAMRVSRRLFINCAPRSSCRTMTASSATSSASARFASAIRLSTCTRPASSNHSTFPQWYGRTLPWTSLKDF
jgi:hypothetical protein